MAEYIKREDAERALLERCKETGYGGLTPDDIRLVMRTPWRIPAADVVERKPGKWIIDRKYGNDIMSGEQMVICSVCHKGVFYGRTNFCPNCGADMRGDDNV